MKAFKQKIRKTLGIKRQHTLVYTFSYEVESCNIIEKCYFRVKSFLKHNPRCIQYTYYIVSILERFLG